MALRNIVKVGDDTLRKTSKPVTDFDGRLNNLLDDMWETMREQRGLGLAAPQVGILRRAVVIEVPDPKSADAGDDEDAMELISYELVNPVILESSGEAFEYEGCLSVPGKTGKVRRPARVKIQAQDRKGRYFILDGEGLLAKAVFHELDHLDGVLFIDIAEEIEEVE